MDKLPEKIIRFDMVKVEYGLQKMCQCSTPHYEVDYQNRLVYCADCRAIIDPFNALVNIARNRERMDDHTEQMLEQRRQIGNYHPRRVVIKKLEKKYISSGKYGLEPSCPHCGKVFSLEKLLEVPWCNTKFLDTFGNGGNDGTTDMET